MKNTIKKMKETQEELIETILLKAERDIKSLTKQTVKISLLGYVSPDNNIKRVLEVVAESLGMSVTDFLNTSRKREYTDLRFISVLILCKKFPLIKSREIAYYIKRDRTTIYNAKRTGKNYLENDKIFKKKFKTAINYLNKKL